VYVYIYTCLFLHVCKCVNMYILAFVAVFLCMHMNI
jgi:hypothetical protein